MKKIKENLYMFEYKTNVLLYTIKKDCYLIDSGKSNTLKKEIENFILDNNLNLKGIINTHCHSDHVSNNDINNCKNIYASDIERLIIENSYLQLDILYGGKHPEFLEQTFLHSNSFKTKSLPDLQNIKYIDLKGHSSNMIGVLIENDVLYVGDAIFSEYELKSIPYLYDVDMFLKSLEELKKYKDITVISSHIGIVNDIHNIIESNINYINNLVNNILKFCINNRSFEEIFKYICESRNIELNIVNYYIINTTIKNIISYLLDKNLLQILFENYNLYYKTME